LRQALNLIQHAVFVTPSESHSSSFEWSITDAGEIERFKGAPSII